ncbi:nitrous oxide-stimulated promoter family protein [Prevotella sp. KH2C16]|uniref:nitrous oxide-stimulated promoter family protein n=1 Tax=Prevotella sp. KH2C16 TaxID=1855325 RepID=UPI000B87072A|nr:nitrous oxide-stimulated promoter family protein [Prevotella sp. KH2C16]
MGKRREEERKTVALMIRLYCKHHLRQKVLSEEYQQLTEYCANRLAHCRWGDEKPTCRDCPVHCYAPAEREKIRTLMRWVGPRMMLYAPLRTIRHIMRGKYKS